MSYEERERCSRSPGCPPADTLAGDGNAYLKRDTARRETGEREEEEEGENWCDEGQNKAV